MAAPGNIIKPPRKHHIIKKSLFYFPPNSQSKGVGVVARSVGSRYGDCVCFSQLISSFLSHLRVAKRQRNAASSSDAAISSRGTLRSIHKKTFLNLQIRIFRRGIYKYTTDYFIMEKIDIIIARIWAWIMRVFKLEKFFPTPPTNGAS